MIMRARKRNAALQGPRRGTADNEVGVVAVETQLKPDVVVTVIGLKRAFPELYEPSKAP